MNSLLVSPRSKKRKQKDEMKEQIVVQVHKSILSNNGSDTEGGIHSASTTNSSEDNVNRTYTLEDTKHVESSNNRTFIGNYEKKEDEEKKEEDKRNENDVIDVKALPSRDISVDGDSQINSKILSLIETEMKRDINKHSHFTDSRPQSLSFYEDERVPEELSGNLELLSPEERKHYHRKRKEYTAACQMDTEEMNAYNAMQDALCGGGGGRLDAATSEDIMAASAAPAKKSKSKKKRHAADHPDLGLGDSREMMIPKEKRKSKKKKQRDNSPIASNTSKRKHKKREEEYDLRTDIAVTLEELQDDVFENSMEFSLKPENMKKSPRKSDKLYVQKKNKFEVTSRPSHFLNRQSAQDLDDAKFGKRISTYPIEISVRVQKVWTRLSTLCHGLLGGLALGHWLYLVCNFHRQDVSFLVHYAYYSDIYVGLYFALCVLCLVSVFDRIDIAHLDKNYMKELWNQKRSTFIVILYITCFIVHLSTANYDDKLSLMSYQNENSNISIVTNITGSELNTWNHLSLWRALLAFSAWIFVGLGPPDDMLQYHLKNLEAYLPNK
ncbi:unnamed protein product [Phaedon cochleariae]|uniref:Uncharacterized protein n=1 Tax=Phaedon cochleariae TaxID=80249 RepID=A0A9P0GPW1_PHACE|nr:unnamed protein product [Phaedon cochleariae]